MSKEITFLDLLRHNFGNYRIDYKDAENVNDKRTVNTTFVIAQNATAARAAGYGDADYSLIWFTTYYPDELARATHNAHIMCGIIY